MTGYIDRSVDKGWNQTLIGADKVKFTTVALGYEDHRPFNVTIFYFIFFHSLVTSPGSAACYYA